MRVISNGFTKMSQKEGLNGLFITSKVQKLCLLCSVASLTLLPSVAMAQRTLAPTPLETQDLEEAKQRLRRDLSSQKGYERQRSSLRSRPRGNPVNQRSYTSQPYVAAPNPTEIFVRADDRKKVGSSNYTPPAAKPSIAITVEDTQSNIKRKSVPIVAPVYTAPAPVLTPEMLQTQPIQIPQIAAPATKSTPPISIITNTNNFEIEATKAPKVTVPVRPVAAPSLNAPIVAEANNLPVIMQEQSSVTSDIPDNVTLYDASAGQDAVAFDLGKAVSESGLDSNIGFPEELTNESETILNKLPMDIFPEAGETINAFDMNRNDATRGLSNSMSFESQSSIGADIAVKRQNMDVNYELEKAYNALLQGNTEIAVMIYNDILGFDPKNKTALFGLATTYHKLGLLDKARPLYGTLLELDPYNKETLNNFLALVGEEAPESAIAYLEQLKVNNGDFSPIYAQLAQLYKKQRNLPSAILNMQQATAISPENMSYMYNLAVLYDANGDVRRAEALYRQIIKAGLSGKEIPASISDIQERLTFLASN